MRILSVGLGAVLLVGGAYIVVGERLVGTSANGTINARVMTLRAPIAGTVSLNLEAVGARLGEGEAVASIADERFDNTRLLELERELASLETERARLDQQLDDLGTRHKAHINQSERYREGRLSQIEARIGEAEAAVEAAASRKRRAESALERAAKLKSRGVKSEAALEEAQADQEVSQHDLYSAEQRLAYLKTELASAKDGVFLGDSFNDMPYSAQRMQEIEQRFGELGADIAQIDRRITLTRRQIDAERVRVRRLTSASVMAPATGMVWNILTEDGEFVQRGQDIMRFVDCSHPMITASVAETTYNTLRSGDTAQFRLFGDDRVFPATIIRLGGAGARQLYSGLAVAPSEQHLKQFDVALTAPALTDNSDLECAVGRTGRLLYSEGPLARIRQFLARFGF